MQLIKSIAEVTKPPLRAELSMQSLCFSFVTELFILLHSAFTEGVWIPLPCTAAGSWLLTDAGMGRLVNKGIPRAFHFHDPVAQLFSSSFLDELGLSTKEGLTHQPPHTWHCLLTCFDTEPEKNILAELSVVLHCQGVLQQPVWREWGWRVSSLCPPGFIHKEHSAEVSRETTNHIRKQNRDLA